MQIGMAARISVALPHAMPFVLVTTLLLGIPRNNPQSLSPLLRSSIVLLGASLLNLSQFESFYMILGLFFVILFNYIVTTSTCMSANLIQHDCSTHIAVNYRFVCERVAIGDLVVGLSKKSRYSVVDPDPIRTRWVQTRNQSNWVRDLV